MIKQIRIKNYKTCQDVKIMMKEPLMALIGRNAVGKTNTLNGISLASHAIWSELSQLTLEGATKGFSGEFIFQRKSEDVIYTFQIYGKKEIYVRDSLQIKTNDRIVKIFNKNQKVSLKLIGHNNPIFLPDDVFGLDFLIGIMFSKKGRPNFIEEALKYKGHLMTVLAGLLNVRYYGVQEQPNLTSITEEEFEEWKESSKSKNINKKFSCQYYDFYKNRPEDFDQYLTLAKSLRLIDDVKAYKLRKDSTLESLGDLYIFLFEVYGKRIYFNWLSDGTKRVLRLLFHIFYDNASLMLIEEPESSIHHGLLIKLLSIFRQYANDKKILISTHSEQILNQLKPEQLIYLYNEKGNTKLKYVTGRNLNNVRKYLQNIGPLGEYATSGELETDLEN